HSLRWRAFLDEFVGVTVEKAPAPVLLAEHLSDTQIEFFGTTAAGGAGPAFERDEAGDVGADRGADLLLRIGPAGKGRSGPGQPGAALGPATLETAKAAAHGNVVAMRVEGLDAARVAVQELVLRRDQLRHRLVP